MKENIVKSAEAFEHYYLRSKLGITSHLTDEEYQLVKQGAKSEENSEIYDDKIKMEEGVTKINVKQNILSDFWFRRQNEARRYNILQIISNLLY